MYPEFTNYADDLWKSDPEIAEVIDRELSRRELYVSRRACGDGQHSDE